VELCNSASAFQAYPNRGAHFKLQLHSNKRIDLIGSGVTVVRGKVER
jgi:hypothetical protein